MKIFSTILFLGSLLLLACNANYSTYPTSVDRNTYQHTNLPSNPDPNKCYVRCVSPDKYETFTEDYLTYSLAEADEYPHELIEILVSEASSKWEYQQYKGCKSINPADCMVWCFKEYSTIFDTIYVPLDATLGTPYIKSIEIMELTQKGGVESFQEVDCELLNYNLLAIKFEQGSSSLSQNAKYVIDEKLFQMMTKIPNVQIEINGHTDARGNSDTNQLLSEQRANAVVNYLVENGISKARLIAIGHGESRLKNHCKDGAKCTESEHDVNNRIEFRVLN